MTAAILEVHGLLRDALARVFTQAGLAVLGSHPDPDGFVQTIRQHRPQVALLGVLLPETAGQVLRQLQEQSLSLPVVVLGAATNKGKVAECHRLGATAYLDRFRVSCEQVLAAVHGAAAGQPPSPDAPLALQLGTASHSEHRPDPLAGLSERALEVLGLIGIGMVNRAIATALGISEHTVKVHVSRLYRKLGHHSRTELALLARDFGLAAPQLFG